MPGAPQAGSTEPPRHVPDHDPADVGQQAERILAVAREVAATLYAEAQSGSRSLREEVIRWAEAHRASAQAEARALVDEARKEAARLRADALSEAMAEAQETARRYVDMAVGVAKDEAETLREEAAAVVRRAADGVLRSSIRLRDRGLLSSEDLTSLQHEAEVLRGLAEATASGSTESAGEDRAADPAASAGSADPDTGGMQSDLRGPLPRQRAASEGAPLGSNLGSPPAPRPERS